MSSTGKTFQILQNHSIVCSVAHTGCSAQVPLKLSAPTPPIISLARESSPPSGHVGNHRWDSIIKGFVHWPLWETTSDYAWQSLSIEFRGHGGLNTLQAYILNSSVQNKGTPWPLATIILSTSPVPRVVHGCVHGPSDLWNTPIPNLPSGNLT